MSKYRAIPLAMIAALAVLVLSSPAGALEESDRTLAERWTPQYIVSVSTNVNGFNGFDIAYWFNFSGGVLTLSSAY
jgi:hypothetical protein